VSGSTGASSASRPGPKSSGGAYGAAPQQVSEAERQKQLEQLAELGVNIPTELRGTMAMAGEWTVTATRVVETNSDKLEEKDPGSTEARAIGVKRERDRTEEEKEQEEAIKGLFKKPRKWGIDSKTMPTGEDAELEALLSGPLVKTKKEESEPPEIKTEDNKEEAAQAEPDEAVHQEPSPPIKAEPEQEGVGADIGPTKESVPEPSPGGAAVPAIMFKKRKPKNVRQK
jgi:hypothetical protein